MGGNIAHGHNDPSFEANYANVQYEEYSNHLRE